MKEHPIYTLEQLEIAASKKHLEELRNVFSNIDSELDDQLASRYKNMLSGARTYDISGEQEQDGEIARMSVGNIYEYGADPGEPVDYHYEKRGDIVITLTPEKVNYNFVDYKDEKGTEEEIDDEVREAFLSIYERILAQVNK